MKLNDLLKGINILSVNGDLNIDINNIAYDSRKVKENTLFICIKGFNSDGHKYIESAIEKGAKAFLVQEDINIEGYTFIKVEDTRASMANVADNFYNNPSKELGVIGVTGTNGKTSITTFLSEILSSNNKKVGLVGTIKIFDGDKEVESSSTTPESIDLQKHFRTMIDNGCDYCAMEVSSHSLVLNRVDETEFKLGIFTNLTPEHLDFHKDLEDYRNAKEKLFYKTTTANIINIDDEGGAKIYENIKSLSTPCYTYGIDNKADFMAKNIKIDARGVSYTLVTPTYEEEIFVPVPGKFTVYNTLAVIAACYMLNISKEIVKESLGKTKGVAGRFETITNDKGISVIVDYAHTPDALEKALNSARQHCKGKLWCIFGCGGDRDAGKRPLMAKAAEQFADLVIVTQDNPRTEDPNKIEADILTGFSRMEDVGVIPDREEAIKFTIENAVENDVIVIAGKGHENYQIIGDKTLHFSDQEVAEAYLTKK